MNEVGPVAESLDDINDFGPAEAHLRKTAVAERYPVVGRIITIRQVRRGRSKRASLSFLFGRH